jgi:chromosome segregation ATPase
MAGGALADKLERLQNELESIQMEANRSLATPDSELEGREVDDKRMREMEENVRMKNKQIKQLLEDIEQVENDSVVYQNKLVEVRDQLADATFQMDSMANEYLSTKESLKNHTNLIESLRDENRRLALQMEEFHEGKRMNDQRMEQMGSEVCKRLYCSLGHEKQRS